MLWAQNEASYFDKTTPQECGSSLLIIYNQRITNIHLYLYISEKQYGNIVMKIKESKFTDIMWNIIDIYLDMVFLKFTCIVIVQDKCLSFRKGVMVI